MITAVSNPDKVSSNITAQTSSLLSILPMNPGLTISKNLKIKKVDTDHKNKFPIKNIRGKKDIQIPTNSSQTNRLASFSSPIVFLYKNNPKLKEELQDRLKSLLKYLVHKELILNKNQLLRIPVIGQIAYFSYSSKMLIAI